MIWIAHLCGELILLAICAVAVAECVAGAMSSRANVRACRRFYRPYS